MTIEQLKNELLNKNLELVDQMNNSYLDVESNMDALNTTKEKNEELIEVFQSYIEQWQQGVISIGEAKRLIQNTVADNGLEIEALDQRISSVGDYRGSWNDTRDSIYDDLEDISEEEWDSTEEEQEMWDQKIAQLDNFRGTFEANIQSMVANFSTQMDTMLAKFASTAEQMEAYANRIADAARRARDAENDAEDGDDNDRKSGSNSSNHSSSGGSSNNSNRPSGPASDPDYTSRTHHKGILAGRVDESLKGKTSISEQLRAIATNPPKENEALKIVKNDEWIFTNPQVENLLKNFNYTSHLALSAPMTMPVDLGENVKPSQQINFNGGIQITEAQNVTDIADGIMRGGLKQALLQATHRR